MSCGLRAEPRASAGRAVLRINGFRGRFADRPANLAQCYESISVRTVATIGVDGWILGGERWLAQSLLEPRVVAYGGEVVVLSRLPAERREPLD